jgi:hypothetical protein
VFKSGPAVVSTQQGRVVYLSSAQSCPLRFFGAIEVDHRYYNAEGRSVSPRAHIACLLYLCLSSRLCPLPEMRPLPCVQIFAVSLLSGASLPCVSHCLFTVLEQSGARCAPYQDHHWTTHTYKRTFWSTKNLSLTIAKQWLCNAFHNDTCLSKESVLILV